MTLSSPARRVMHAVLALGISITTGIACDSEAPSGPEKSVGAARAPHSIAIEPSAVTIVANGLPVALSAAVRDGAGNTLAAGVHWSSSAPTIVAVDGSGRITGASSGEALVTAASGAVVDTAFVRVIGGEAAAAARVLVEPRVVSLASGGTLRLDATVIDAQGRRLEGVPVAWSSADPTIMAVDGDGVVQAASDGQARIIVAVGALRDTAWVKVGSLSPPARVRVQPRADTLASATDDLALFAQVRDTEGTLLPDATVRWHSVNPAVAYVSDDGLVVAASNGATKIVANYGSESDTADVYVSAWGFPVAVTVRPRTDTISRVGGTLDLEADIRDVTGRWLSEDYARWTSLDPAIASVHWRTGVVTALTEGLARVLVRAGYARDTAYIWVAPAPSSSEPTSIRLSPAAVTLTYSGESTDLSAQVLDDDGRPVPGVSVVWSSTTPQVATVSGSGGVVAIAEGSTWVVARAGVLADSAHIDVELSDGEDVPTTGGVKVTPSVDTVAVGGAISLMAEVRDANGNRVSSAYVHWRTLDPSAELDASETGVLTGLTVRGISPGVARIVAMHESDADTAIVHVVPGGTSGRPRVQISVAADTIPSVGGTLQLNAAAFDTNGNNLGSAGIAWSGLDASIATVSQAGLVKGLATGVARVTAAFQTAADTVLVWVAPGTGGSGGTPQTGTTVPAVIVGYRGTGTVLVSSGVPLPPGLLFPGDTRKLAVYVNGREQSLYVEPLTGRHPDGSVRSMLVQFPFSVVAGQQVPAQIVMGPTVNRTTPDVPKSATVYGYGAPLPPAALLPTSPSYLVGTGIVGETLPVGTSFDANWESNFVSIGDAKWRIFESEYGTSVLDGNKVTTYNYYDRALSNFAWWARTGDPEYWRRAVLYELAYRDVYLRLYDYRVQPHNIQIEGLEIHYLLTGDPESRLGVAKAADYYFTIWLPEIGNARGTYTENRIQARTLDGLMTAARLGITTRNFSAAARQALVNILGTQRTDGSWRFPIICDTQYNYMTGLLLDALIKYYTYFDNDPRIIAAMGKSLDFLWSTQWLGAAGAFKYASGDCPGFASTDPAPDLNLLIVNGFGWYAKVAGNTSYRQDGDLVFHQGVAHAWLGNTPAQADKQFNQQYRSAYRYLFYRQ